MSEKNNECAARRPDCVIEILRGNSLLVICEFYKQNTTVAVADKMMEPVRFRPGSPGRLPGRLFPF